MEFWLSWLWKRRKANYEEASSKFQPIIFSLSVIIFGIEVLIATFAHDKIIRPYVGDLLVVILIYCFVKAFLNTPVLNTAIAVLLFAYMVEVLQFFNLINRVRT